MNLKKMERYLRVNLLGPGPSLIKNSLPFRGLIKFEKHCSRWPHYAQPRLHSSLTWMRTSNPLCSVRKFLVFIYFSSCFKVRLC